MPMYHETSWVMSSSESVVQTGAGVPQTTGYHAGGTTVEIFRIHYMDFPDCLLLLLNISVFLLFSFFSVFTLFSCRFRAVD